MPKSILVAGSLHHDIVVDAERLPQFDETLPGTAVRYIPGGKGRNQAAAIAHNAGRCFMAGRVGSDAQGTAMIDNLRQAGVDVSLIQTGQGQTTGMSVAIVNPAGEYGAVIVSGANLALDADKVEIPAGAGYLLLQNEISESCNIVLARKARAAGLITVLNAAPARPLLDALASLIDIVIVNRVEASGLTGLPVSNTSEAIEAAKRLSQTVPKVIVTLGADGLVQLRAGGRAEYQPCFRATVVSGHGAGDFFTGAFVSQMADGSEFEATIHYAQAAAAVYVSTEIDKRHQIRPVQIRARLGEDEL